MENIKRDAGTPLNSPKLKPVHTNSTLIMFMSDMIFNELVQTIILEIMVNSAHPIFFPLRSHYSNIHPTHSPSVIYDALTKKLAIG